jgi:hypothetical protein
LLLGDIAGAVLVYAFFGYVQRHLPPDDFAAFSRSDQVGIERDTRDGRGTSRNVVRLTYPAAVRIDDDFAVQITGTLQRVADPSVLGDRGLTLQSGGEGAEILAGATRTERGGEVGFRRVWQVTPKKEGMRLFTFGYAGDDLTPTAPPPDARGFVDQTVAWSGPRSETLAPPRLDAQVGPRLAVSLTQDRAQGPTEVRFAIEVLTTLGVKKRTFNAAQLLFTFVGFLFSAGLVKLLSGKGGDD